MESLRKSIVGGGIIILLLGIIYSGFASQAQQMYCGYIKYKVDATRYGKNIAYAEPIFVVNFEGYGIKEVHADWNSYLSKNVGDKVCYSLLTDKEGVWEDRLVVFLFCALVFAFVAPFIWPDKDRY